MIYNNIVWFSEIPLLTYTMSSNDIKLLEFKFELDLENVSMLYRQAGRNLKETVLYDWLCENHFTYRMYVKYKNDGSEYRYGDYHYGIDFEHENDACLFKLTWG